MKHELEKQQRRQAQLPTRYRLLLLLAVLFHLSLLASWRLGYWHRWTFDSSATRGQRGWDFFALYQAGHNVRNGISIYESDNDRIDVVAPVYTPYRYLPFPAYTLGWLLSALPPLWALRIWVVFMELTLLACAYVSWRTARDPRQGVILISMWLCFTPYYLELYMGQFSMVQAALVLALLLAAERAIWDWRFGWPWIMSLLWKQNTALLIPVLLRLKRWRALLWGGLAVLATSLPYFVRYPGTLGVFLGNLRSGPPAPQLGNLGVRQFLYSLASALWPDWSSDTHLWLQRLWVLAILGLALWLTWRVRRPDPVPLICLWVTSFFLLYHHVWEHHYVMLLPVYVVLYRRDRAWLIIVLYALTALWTPYVLIDPRGLAAYHMPMRWTPLEPRIVDVLYHACKALPTLALWGYLARQLARTGEERRA